MTHLTMELVADQAQVEIEERIRRAARMREAAGRGASGVGIRRRVAMALMALAARLDPAPAGGESPVSAVASARVASS